MAEDEQQQQRQTMDQEDLVLIDHPTSSKHSETPEEHFTPSAEPEAESDIMVKWRKAMKSAAEAQQLLQEVMDHLAGEIRKNKSKGKTAKKDERVKEGKCKKKDKKHGRHGQRLSTPPCESIEINSDSDSSSSSSSSSSSNSEVEYQCFHGKPSHHRHHGRSHHHGGRDRAHSRGRDRGRDRSRSRGHSRGRSRGHSRGHSRGRSATRDAGHELQHPSHPHHHVHGPHHHPHGHHSHSHGSHHPHYLHYHPQGDRASCRLGRESSTHSIERALPLALTL